MKARMFSLRTERQGYTDITPKVREALAESGITSGICVVFCPHTTGAITLNENADPDVVRDMVAGLDKTFPHRPEYRHAEGNTTAHLKSGAVGVSQTVIVEDGELILGRWQDIYFCEFDGPRTRNFYVKILSD